MRLRSLLVPVLLAAALPFGAATAQSVEAAVKARQAHMGLYAFNLGPLGAMAKGEVPYDAAAASAAAANLAALSAMDQSRYWPPGSESGAVEGSRALPAIWEPTSDIMAKAAAFNDAVTALVGAAGTDLPALQAAMGAVGGACGACHQSYRAAN